MIEIDSITASAVEVACREYLACMPLREAAETRALVNLMVGPGGIIVPSGGDWDTLRSAYFGIAERADSLASAAPSVADELALRRAGAALRQAGRLILPSRPTKRIPVVTDAEVIGRLRAGHHRDPKRISVKPGESIQDAIDRAEDGDEVYLEPGVHAVVPLVLSNHGVTFTGCYFDEPTVEIDAAPIEPIDDEASIPVEMIDLGGES